MCVPNKVFQIPCLERDLLPEDKSVSLLFFFTQRKLWFILTKLFFRVNLKLRKIYICWGKIETGHWRTSSTILSTWNLSPFKPRIKSFFFVLVSINIHKTHGLNPHICSEDGSIVCIRRMKMWSMLRRRVTMRMTTPATSETETTE